MVNEEFKAECSSGSESNPLKEMRKWKELALKRENEITGLKFHIDLLEKEVELLRRNGDGDAAIPPQISSGQEEVPEGPAMDGTKEQQPESLSMETLIDEHSQTSEETSKTAMTLAEELTLAANDVVSRQGNFVFEKTSGMYFHTPTGYYFDEGTQLFYDSKHQRYLRFNLRSGVYELPPEQTRSSSDYEGRRVQKYDSDWLSSNDWESSRKRRGPRDTRSRDKFTRRTPSPNGDSRSSNRTRLKKQRDIEESQEGAVREVKVEAGEVLCQETPAGASNVYDQPTGCVSVSEAKVEPGEPLCSETPASTSYVYDQTTGLYYDYDSGYYYDPVRCLFYEPTSCTYYAYDPSSGQYVVHSTVADQLTTVVDPVLRQQRCKKKKKHRKDIDDVNSAKKEKKRLKNRERRRRRKLAEIEEGEISDLSPPPPDSATGKGTDTSTLAAIGLEYISSGEDDEDSPSSGGSSVETDSTEEDLPGPSMLPPEAQLPCARAIVWRSDWLAPGSLFIITCSGGTIGRSRGANDLVGIQHDPAISKVHCSIRFNESERRYEVKDCGSRNGTLLNDRRLSEPLKESSYMPLTHGASLQVGSTLFNLHIHEGSETRDGCEPGQLAAWFAKNRSAANQDALVTNTASLKINNTKEEERRSQTKNLKMKFGIGPISRNSGSRGKRGKGPTWNPPASGGVHTSQPSAKYEDRAEKRRREVGSDFPYTRHAQPASVHRPIESDNVGHKMLLKMGWKEGEGVGSDKSRVQAPITQNLHESRAGLGSGVQWDMDSQHQAAKYKNQWSKAAQRYAEIEASESQPLPFTDTRAAEVRLQPGQPLSAETVKRMASGGVYSTNWQRGDSMEHG